MFTLIMINGGLNQVIEIRHYYEAETGVSISIFLNK